MPCDYRPRIAGRPRRGVGVLAGGIGGSFEVPPDGHPVRNNCPVVGVCSVQVGALPGRCEAQAVAARSAANLLLEHFRKLVLRKS